jgi:hypothetical protein
VRIIKSNAEIENAINTNLEHAVRTSLLLLPSTFKAVDMYKTIASLSYIGDPRMIVGENPKKVYIYKKRISFFFSFPENRNYYYDFFLLLLFILNTTGRESSPAHSIKV